MAKEMIIVNGTPMEYSEYRKMIAARNKAKNPSKKKKKAVQPKFSDELNEMFKKVKLIKSLSAYYNNAYRQWGTVAQNILKIKSIDSAFIRYRMLVRDIESNMAEIAKLNRSKAINQYLEKLGYQLEDLCAAIENLSDAVVKSGILYRYASHECINGEGRRLGLHILIRRTFSTTRALKTIIKNCSNIDKF